MAVKSAFFRRLIWRFKCFQVIKVPTAFWVGFWFVLGAYQALIVIGWISHLAVLVFGEV
ncbi:hypothetical protein [Pseudomonas sp. HMWF006]|uniref:hypothetical protein n=1 Tax=Pseudomonas sp. HMWF006 TaxID=2056843 RepID=UPI001304A21F|nr:hypothetical protein [Pseudomonas sp. HMWF006]